LLPGAQGIGRPRQVDLREIINGIFYVVREGCSWRALPHDLPPWQTVHNYFRHWQRLGVWQKIHTKIRNQVRKRLERTDNPTAGIIDSQSVKTTEKRGKCMVTIPETSESMIYTVMIRLMLKRLAQFQAIT
jgi:transposase